MIFNVLTLFPEMFCGLNHSILGRAQEEQIIKVNTVNIRDYSNNKHKKVDDYPYGGGAGMVMQIQPIRDAIESLDLSADTRIIYLSPKGVVFNQSIANELAKEKSLVLICGHYEGIDQRVINKYVTDEISIGDFVLTGGELPAMVLIDAVSRLVDGVLGKNVSYEDESHYSGLLEYSHYTRPADFDGLSVPDVLLSGNHKNIEVYRREESLRLTKLRRPDMIDKLKKENKLSKKDLEFLRNV